MAFHQKMGNVFTESRVSTFRDLPDDLPFLFSENNEPYTEFNRYISQKATGSWASPNSRVAAAQAYKMFLSWLEDSNQEWDEVRYRHLVSFRDYLVRSGSQASTINNRLTFIHQFFFVIFKIDCL